MGNVLSTIDPYPVINPTGRRNNNEDHAVDGQAVAHAPASNGAEGGNTPNTSIAPDQGQAEISSCVPELTAEEAQNMPLDREALLKIFPEEVWIKILRKVEDKINVASASPYFKYLLSMPRQ